MRVNDFKTALFIAYKSIRKGSRSTIVLLIIILTLSFLNMMFITGILNGLTSLMPRVVRENLSGDIVINPQEVPLVKEFISNQTTLRSEIATIPGIIATARRYTLAGSVAFDKDKSGQYKNVSSVIMGIDPIEDAKVMAIARLIKFGVFLETKDTDQIVLSSALAGGYGDLAPSDLGGVAIGDKVRVSYSNGVMRTYTVKGIYKDTMGIYENFISAREAESILNISDRASQILVKADLSEKPVESYMRNIQTVAPNLKIQSYNDLLGSFGPFLAAFKLISIIVSIISIVTAAVTIFIIIYVNALHKRRQIGIFKAIGIKQNILVYSYLFQSLFYTTVSILFGAILVFAVLYPLFLRYPIDVAFGKINLVFTSFGITMGVASFLIAGILAGFIPSRLVAKEDILKAIWG